MPIQQRDEVRVGEFDENIFIVGRWDSPNDSRLIAENLLMMWYINNRMTLDREVCHVHRD
jgi:hypothetical protein